MLKEKSKILIIALLLSLIFSVGAVAAAEDMTFDQSNMGEVPLGASDVTPEVTQEIDDDVDLSSKSGPSELEVNKGSGNETGSLKANNDAPVGISTVVSGTTFSSLQTAINNANDGDVLILNNNFEQTSSSPIEITKSITIQGNGYTLNGKNVVIFYLRADGIKLKDIVFKSSMTSTQGSAIQCHGDYCELDGCTFSGFQSCAIRWWGSYGKLTNCVFNGNSPDRWDLVMWHGESSTISGCTFTNNKCDLGAPIGITADGCIVTGCTFTNNDARYGPAIEWSGANGFISNSVFKDNYLNYDVDLIDTVTDSEIIVKMNTHCNYINAIYVSSKNADVTFNNVQYFDGQNMVNTNNKYPVKSGPIGQQIKMQAYDADNNLVRTVYARTNASAQASFVNFGRYRYVFTFDGNTYFKSASKTVGAGDYYILYQLIDRAGNNAVINLNRDYAYTPGIDSNSFVSIRNDNVTINGNGYSIDGKGLKSIFYIGGDNVVLNNITFKNGKSSYGGAIHWYGINGVLINSKFINNSANYGGAVYWVAYGNKYYSASNDYYDPYYGGYGSLIMPDNYFDDFVNEVSKAKGTVSNCIFTDNTASNHGGAIWMSASVEYNYYSYRSSVSGYDYENVEADLKIGERINIIDSIFTDNVSPSGSAIFIKSEEYIYFYDQLGYGNENLLDRYTFDFTSTVKDCVFVGNNGIQIFAEDIDFIADYNWWGNNATNFNETPNTNADITNWYFLNMSADKKIATISLNNLYDFVSGAVSSNPNYSLADVVLALTAKDASFAKDSVLITGNGKADVAYENSLKAYSLTASYGNASMTLNLIPDSEFSAVLNSSIIDYGENTKVIIDLVDDATGYVGVIVYNDKGEYLNRNVTVGEAREGIIISGLNVGEYEVKVIYWGDAIYNKAEAILPLSVRKTNPQIGINVDGDLFVGGTVTITVTAPDDGDLFVLIDSIEVPYTGSNGIYTVTVSSATFGNHTVVAVLENSTNYNDGHASTSFEINKKDPTIVPTITPGSAGESTFITITIDDDATGFILVTAGERQFNLQIRDSRVFNLELENVDAGNYNVTIIYTGDGKYNECALETSFVVDKISSTIDIAAPASADVGDNITVHVTVGPNSATGNVTIWLDGVDVTADYGATDLYNGELSFILINLANGTHTVEVRYNGDNNHNPSNIESAVINVIKPSVGPDVRIIGSTVTYGEIATVTVELPRDATGTVTVTVNNNPYNATVFGGLAVVEIPGLAGGDYEGLAVVYSGDSRYDPFTGNANVYVKRAESRVIIVPISEEIYFPGNVDVYYQITNKTVEDISVLFNNTPVDFKLENNKIVLNNLAAGLYYVTISNEENENYTGDSSTISFNVLKSAPVILDNIPENVRIGDEILIEVNVVNATGMVSLSIDDEVFEQLQLVNGTAVFNITRLNLAFGRHAAVIRYLGDDNHLDSSDSHTFMVNKLDPTIGASVKGNIVGQTTVITATINDDATEFIMFAIGDDLRISRVIGGVATGSFDNLAEGKYDVVVSYSGDGKYNALNKTVSFDVIAENIDIEINGSEVIIETPENKTGNITVIVDGVVVYNATNVTNESIPLDNLPEGEHNITIIFVDEEGNVIVTNQTVNIPYKAVATIIVVETQFSRYASDYNAGERGAYFYAILYDVDGNPLVNKTVQIAVNGPIYNVTTDKNGKAGLQVNLGSANTYTYALFFGGDNKYNASMIASSKLSIVKKPTSIIANNVQFKTSAKTKTVTVALTTMKNQYDGKMYLNKGKTLTLTVNGKTYTAKTDENGVAKFNIALTTKGTFTATIKFAGDKTYESTSKTIKITISDSAKANPALNGVGVGFDAKPLENNNPLNVNGNFADYIARSGIPTSNVDPAKKNVYFVVEETFTRDANDYNAGERGAFFYGVLKDSDGNVLAGKTVQIAVNGPIYNVTTDAMGRAGLQVNLGSANTYTYALSFSGDDKYNPAALASTKLIVEKKPITIVASDQSFAASASTKNVKVTLKTSENKYNHKTYLSAGKKVTVKVDGKTYTGSINDKGQVNINVKLTKKGTYNAVISFAGDQTYEAATKTIKITIK